MGRYFRTDGQVTGPVDVRVIEGSAQYDQRGHDGGIFDNPAAGTIVATAGDRPAGLYEIVWLVSAVNAVECQFRWRDSVDTVKENVSALLPARGVATGKFYIPFAANDDLVILLPDAGITGRVAGSLSWRRIKP